MPVTCFKGKAVGMGKKRGGWGGGGQLVLRVVEEGEDRARMEGRRAVGQQVEGNSARCQDFS